MSIADQITRLNNAKANIKQAIENKGVTVKKDALLDEYPALIESIEGGGGNSYYEDLYNLRTSNGTNMAGMFAYCTAPELDLRSLDISKATDMRNMFVTCSSSINIDGWDISNVTTVQNMFSNVNLDNVVLTNLSFLNTKNLSYMLSGANGTTLDLSSWDISNVTSMSNMFAGDFKKIDLSGWNTSKVTDMSYMFSKYNNPLVELIIPDWDMTNTTSSSNFMNASYMSKLILIDLSRSNDATITKIASFLPTRTTTTFGKVLVPYDTSQETYDGLVAKYWAPIGASMSPIPTSIEIIAELDEIYPGKSTKVFIGCEPWNADPSKVELVVLDNSIATIDKDNRVTSTGVLGDIVLEARIIDTQEVIGTKTIIVSETDSYPNIVKFRLASTPSSYSTVITVNGSAKKLSALTYDSVMDIYSYDNGSSITSINFSDSYISELIKLDVSNITTMEIMFYNCKSLVSLDSRDWRTNNVTRVGQMFSKCTNLTDLDISNFDISHITSMNYIIDMFYNCNSLHTLRLDNCNNDTINKIITSDGFPTNAIDGITRTIYCKEENAAGLSAPECWVFSFVD